MADGRFFFPQHWARVRARTRGRGSDEKAVFSKIDSYYIYSVLAYESEGIQR